MVVPPFWMTSTSERNSSCAVNTPLFCYSTRPQRETLPRSLSSVCISEFQWRDNIRIDRMDSWVDVWIGPLQSTLIISPALEQTWLANTDICWPTNPSQTDEPNSFPFQPTLTAATVGEEWWVSISSCRIWFDDGLWFDCESLFQVWF